MLITSLFFSVLFMFVFITDYIEIETRGWRKEFNIMKKWTNIVINSLICIAIILGLLIIAQKVCYKHAQYIKYKYMKYMNEEVSYVKISEYK